MNAERLSADDSSSLVGMQGEAFEVVIERGKIREFATATRAQLPEYWEDPLPVVPPTFLTTAAHWSPSDIRDLLERTGWDAKRMLHAEQEFVFPGTPPHAGTVLRGVTRVDSVREREGRRGGRLRFLVLATEYRDSSDAVVALVRTTVVETSHAPGGES
jgi:hypothetical protein